MEKVRILAVDDEPGIREIFGRFLSRLGYLVDTAGSGEEAIKLAGRKEYDLVVTDLRMRGMSGLTALEGIRKHLPKVKAIVVSGSLHQYEAELDMALQSERIYGALQKPVNLRALGDLIQLATLSKTAAA